ncbi:AraC family transcriptional regulator [Paenibacillus alvei]|uniref:XylS/AraC transcriptional regulator n=1 Tax=Paenibacillus alvei TaxID=44250 RepID=A0A383RFT8_PAEAL|nr:AraC family transcriptional regulator [Paenibacillus alvei]SYX85219.1 XylS/AraC transcriptional regulator [Paenibacillus alvei]
MQHFHFPMISERERSLPLVVTTVGSWVSQQEIVRLSGYPDYQWLQCTSGRGEFWWKGMSEPIVVEAGQGVFLYPNIPHEYRPIEEPWGIYWFGFQGSLSQELLTAAQLYQSTRITPMNPELTLEPIKRAIALLNRSSFNEGHGTMLSGLAYELIMAWTQFGWETLIREGRHVDNDPLSPLLVWIQEHVHQELTLQQMADQIGVTPQYVCKLFRRTLDMRPLQYVIRLRIRKSKQLLLAYPRLSVQQVGQEVGFMHTSYFIHRFKQQEGMTPVQFRLLHAGKLMGNHRVSDATEVNGT